MSRDTINDHIYCGLSIAISQDSKALSDTIWRVTNNAIEELGSPEWSIYQIRSETIHEFAGHPILLVVLKHAQLSSLLASETAAIDISAHRQSPEMRSTNDEASGSDKWVEKQFSRRGKGHVGRDQTQFRIHGGRADIVTFFEIVLEDSIATAVTDFSSKEDLSWLFSGCNFQYTLFDIIDVLLHHEELLIRVL
jgi:hypothetical protein